MVLQEVAVEVAVVDEVVVILSATTVESMVTSPGSAVVVETVEATLHIQIPVEAGPGLTLLVAAALTPALLLPVADALNLLVNRVGLQEACASPPSSLVAVVLKP